MTANVLEHRRAKAFAEAVEAHRTGQPANRAALGELLDTAEALSALAVPAMDAEVKSVQRARLLAAFEQASAGGRRRWGRRFAITGLVAGVTVSGFAGVAAASSQALPGDTLYGMKRGLEGLRLDLAGSDSERGELLLDQASTRLAEARALVGTGRQGQLSQSTVARLNSALRDMHAEAAKGRDLLRSVYQAHGSITPLQKLADFTETQDGHWSALQSHLPAQVTPVAEQVDQLFGDFNQEVAQAHLDPAPAAGGATPAASDSPSTGQGSSPSGPAAGASNPGSGRSAPVAPSGAGRAGAGQPSTGGSPSQGGSGSAPAGPLGGGNPVSGLVNGLTGPLTGSGTGAGAAPATPAPSGGAPAAAPVPGTTPAAGAAA
ncbi:DUF5667 domain-containing protein, partial [Kitasatospora sp. LaBMicrA B282]|uniref:DUF5667 domain-containing protein n=1 Tax=Kitasatospora sp. LaBMicrA B282 TaxID=3420949 RepID=UPI003D13B9E8